MALHFKYSDDEILIPHNNTHATPPTGESALYVKTDGFLYTKNDAGAETQIGGATSSLPLSGLIAATASNSINSAFSQTWNWDLTTDGTTAFTFGENVASTNGTFDNQILLQVSTLASSTAAPLQISAQKSGSNPYNILVDSGGNVWLQGNQSASAPGVIEITGGISTTAVRGGDIFINGGVGASGEGGRIHITGGITSAGPGGSATVAGGSAAVGTGGAASLTGALGSVSGGAALVVGGGGSGGSNGNGGNATVQGGVADGSGTHGTVRFVTGSPSPSGTLRFAIDGSGAWLLPASAGTTGQLITSNGAGTPPTWQDAPAVNPIYSLNNQLGYQITSSLASSGLTVAASHRAIVRSILVTNLTGAQVTLNADINYNATGAVLIANNMPIPGYGTEDLILRDKVMNPSDLLRFQGPDNTSLHVSVVWEDNTNTAYVGVGQNLSTTSITDIYTSSGNPTVLESILVVNNSATVQDVPVQIVWTDGSNVVQGYFCYNLVIPYGGTIEILENPFRIPTGYKVRATATVASTIAVHVSGKQTT